MIQIARPAADVESETGDELAQGSAILQQEQAVREPSSLEVRTRITVFSPRQASQDQ